MLKHTVYQRLDTANRQPVIMKATRPMNALSGRRPLGARVQVPRSQSLAHTQAMPKLPRTAPEPVYYPSQQEEEGVLHSAFHNAIEAAKPSSLRVAGLQEFAAALLQRRKIPSAGGDALTHMFGEYDTDSDGYLSAAELAGVFASHGIKVTPDQVQALINSFEGGQDNARLQRDQWPDFVYSLAVSDFHARSGSSTSSEDSS